ncbi:MAG: hypothetical protein FJ318_05365 [SAR202 cluster bacterium]|nr:hypothetical protein [SAR202 cluster bacterium]
MRCARDGAPVATPLEWDEVEDARLFPHSHTVRNVLDRLERQGDPWTGNMRGGVSLAQILERLDRLLAGVTEAKEAHAA